MQTAQALKFSEPFYPEYLKRDQFRETPFRKGTPEYVRNAPRLSAKEELCCNLATD